MYTLGVDVGASKIVAALVKNGRILRFQKSTPTKKSSAAILRQVLKSLEAVVGRIKISGIGIGVPCAIDRRGRIIACANIPTLRTERILKAVSAKYRVPVMLENDVKAAALAEIRYGMGRKSKNFVFAALGTGIGGAIVIDGELYKGALGWAGEFGHFIMKCKIQNAKFKILEDWEEVSTKQFLRSKKRPDDLKQFARSIAVGLLNITYALAPEYIVIGGGLSSLWDKNFAAKVASTMKRLRFSPKLPLPKIIRSRFGENAGVIGAALLPLIAKNTK